MTKEEILSVIKRTHFGEKELVTYLYSLSDTVQKVLYDKGYQVGFDLAPSYPKELDNANPYLVFSVYFSYKESLENIAKNDEIDVHVAASNYSKDYEVDYDCDFSQIVTKKKNDAVVYKVNHQVLTGEGEESVLAEVACKISTVVDLSTGVPYPVEVQGVSEVFLKDWVVNVPVIDDNVVTSSVHAQAYLMKDIRVKDYALAMRDSEKYELNVERVSPYQFQRSKQLYSFSKFLDIPRQWMNCPMKWGAVAGFLMYGNSAEPCKMYNVDFYGATGWKAIRIFPDSNYYDIDLTKNVIVDAVLDRRYAKIINEYCPLVRYGDVFHPFESNRFLVSDAWSRDWGEDYILDLFGLLFKRANVVLKFSCGYDVLKRVGKFVKWDRTLIIMKFGRPISEEVFITNYIPMVYKVNELIRVVSDCSHFCSALTYYEDMIQSLCVKIVNTMYGGIRKKVYRKRRPFKLYSWMMPLVAMPYHLNSVYGKKTLSMCKIFPVLKDDLCVLQDAIMRFKYFYNQEYKIYIIKKKDKVVSKRLVLADNILQDIFY